MRSFLLTLTLATLSTAAQADMIGTHYETFNPTSDGLDFVTVQSTRTLAPGQFNLGAFGNYTWNSMPYFVRPGSPVGSYSEPKNNILNSQVHVGLGIMDGWDLGVSAPIAIDKDTKSNDNLGHFGENGLTEVRVNTKYRFLQEEHWGLAVVGTVNFDRTKNNPFQGSDAGPTYNLDVVGDYKLAPGLLLGGNIGYRMRDRGDTIPNTGVSPLKDAMTFSGALSYDCVEIDSTLIAEVYGNRYVKEISVPTDRNSGSLEALVGAKHMVRPDLAVHAGVTAGLVKGPGVPDARIYAGINWQFGAGSEPPPPPPPPVAAAPAPVEEKPSETIVLSSINFATNSTQMTATSRASFKKTAQQLNKNAGTIRKIIVEGHTDNVGTNEFNMKLGEGRARSVQHILTSELPSIASNIQAMGLGETRPIASNDSEAGRAQNRRVEIKIYRNE